jgi:hypothetical protein
MRRLVSLVLLTSFLLAPSLVLAQDAGTPPAEVRREVHLFLHEDVAQVTDDECGLTDHRSQARLFVESEPRRHSIQRTIHDGGRPVDADESPIDEPGCLFEFELVFPDAPGYAFRIAPTLLAKVPFYVLAGSQDPLVLAMDQYGSRTPPLDGITVPTPEPTPTPPPPTPTPIPTPEAGKIDDDTYRIVGRFVLRSEGVVNTATGCYGTGGYSDVSDGAQVIIRDGNNNILGVGRLEDTDLSGAFGCSYIFTMEVPEAPFYQIEFSHRSPLVYTFEEMEDMGWEVWLGLGD